jgi:alpha-glucosidase
LGNLTAAADLSTADQAGRSMALRTEVPPDRAPRTPRRAAGPGTSGAPTWWRGAVGYQVYIRSFADASGDGIGDLRGVRDRLGILAELGVDAIWITPFYASPQADHGYDVADHRAVDPDYGTLDDLDAVVEEAHRHGLRVLIDLVPNHTSARHPWFLDALSSREARHREYYVWRDPTPDGGPPNNWVSKFGGPAWTLHEPTGQYFLHSFLPEQPDLNWANPRVREAFDGILAFWLERGVDGFRVDAAHYLLKDAELRDNPRRVLPPVDDPEAVFASFDHLYDLDQPAVVEIYRRWRAIAHPQDAVLVGEVVLPDPHRVQRYVEAGGLDLAFDFPCLEVGWDASAIRQTLSASLAAGDRLAWPLSSHDHPRAAQRLGGGSRGARRSLAYLTLLSALPGMVFLLQGDELGLEHGQLLTSDQRDPVALRNPGAEGRDGSRTPMPWSPGPNFGFTSSTPWIPFPADRTEAMTVSRQRADERSHWHATRRLLAARGQLPDLATATPLRWLDLAPDVVAFARGSVVAAMNTSDEERSCAIDVGRVDVVYASRDGFQVGKDALLLPPDTSVLARIRPPTLAP